MIAPRNEECQYCSASTPVQERGKSSLSECGSPVSASRISSSFTTTNEVQSVSEAILVPPFFKQFQISRGFLSASSQSLTDLRRRNILWPMHALSRSRCWRLFLVARPALARDYRFDRSMPEEMLRTYLSRAMTTTYLLTGHGDFETTCGC
jgi:hypothetical protein